MSKLIGRYMVEIGIAIFGAGFAILIIKEWMVFSAIIIICGLIVMNVGFISVCYKEWKNRHECDKEDLL